MVEGGWQYNSEAKKIEIDLSQTQPGEAWRLPIEVGIAPDRIEKIEMTAKHQRFEIPSAAEPAAVTLDPNTWLLMDARFAKR